MADAQHTLKPVGGIRAAAVVLQGAAGCGSASAVVSAARPVPVVEERSSYEEVSAVVDGAVCIEHRLVLAVPADYAAECLTAELLRHWAVEGTAAAVDTESGERIVVGWSERFGCEQPLRLVSAEFSSGNSTRQTPAAILTLRSFDTETATRISNQG